MKILSDITQLSEDVEISIRKYLLYCKNKGIDNDSYETELLEIISKSSNYEIEFSR